MMTVMIKEEKSPVLSRKNNFDLSLTRVPSGSARLLNDGGACSACWVRGPRGACVHMCTATICCDLPLSAGCSPRFGTSPCSRPVLALRGFRAPPTSWRVAAKMVAGGWSRD